VDTAGQDEYTNLQTRYTVGVHGYVLLYSVANRTSFELITYINDRLLNALGTEKVPRVLVGNKSDQTGDRQVSTAEGQAKAQELGCTFVECSARRNDHIADVFRLMLIEIEKLDPPPNPPKNCIVS